MLTLRDYQRSALDALYSYWHGGGGNGLLVLPTGAGKALVIAALIKELLEQYPTLRIGCVTHSRELVSQNHKELLGYWPEAPAGIFSAGLNKRDTTSRILFCGIQSVAKKARALGSFDLIIIDECHMISRSADTLYGRFFRDVRETTPDMRVVGLTATPYRLDSGRLDEGDERLFDDVVYDANVGDLIKQGYLSPLVSKGTLTGFDVSGVAKRGGEYVAGQLEEAVDKDWITQAAVDEIVGYGADREGWLAFCCGVSHARNVRDAIRERGITCEMVTGETPTAERDRIIQGFKDRRIRCLTSVAVLTTGFNAPHVDLLALMRPTESAGLYCQMVGRALRKAPGKQNALVLDFGGVVRRHGPIDDIRIKRPGSRSGDGEARMKECPECHCLSPVGTRVCEPCGFEFPWSERDEAKHTAYADSEAAILSTEKLPPHWVPIHGVRGKRHKKPGSPDSLKVTFDALINSYNLWLCFEHEGYAKLKAQKTWLRMGGYEPCPETVQDGLDRIQELNVSEIAVRQTGRYSEVFDFMAHLPDLKCA